MPIFSTIVQSTSDNSTQTSIQYPDIIRSDHMISCKLTSMSKTESPESEVWSSVRYCTKAVFYCMDRLMDHDLTKFKLKKKRIKWWNNVTGCKRLMQTNLFLVVSMTWFRGCTLSSFLILIIMMNDVLSVLSWFRITTILNRTRISRLHMREREKSWCICTHWHTMFKQATDVHVQ